MRQFPDLSCMVVDLPCFSVTRSLTGWYAFLLSFFLRHVSTSTPQGSPGVGRNTFLSSPHLCFIIAFICDSFVSRDDPLMS